MEDKRPRIKDDRILRERIEKFISPFYFSDVNLYSKLYKYKKTITSILHYHAPSRIPFTEVQQNAEYKKVHVGDSFGPTWSTHWFKLIIDLSCDEHWKDNEVRLRWDSQSEAQVWVDGQPKQGLTGSSDNHQLRTDYLLTERANGTEKFEVFIEMACNGMFGAGNNGMINTPDRNKTFCLNMAELATRDNSVDKIIKELQLLIDIHKYILNCDGPQEKGRFQDVDVKFQELAVEDDFSHHALQVGCDVVNCFQPFSESSTLRALKILDGFFNEQRSIDKSSWKYNIHAIGNCHIDTAWLWPYAETERKCARSWSSAVSLMTKYPEYNFACSQAQQIDWVKEKYPSLYNNILSFAEKGNFLPVGGTWVEMEKGTSQDVDVKNQDGNLPSSEGFIRQFFYGQRFFKQEFGRYCEVFWLPDTFGYSAQLPQIIQQAGIKYFLTQKISWSLINKFPHNNFLWQGIDGTSVLTHFPPADTYESAVTVADKKVTSQDVNVKNQILKTCSQNKDKGLVKDGILLYGHGDGGGGPTEDMIQKIDRLKNLPSFPRIEHSTPLQFFKKLDKSSHLLHTWVGELYLELHQGTFTSQAKLKKQNRECEHLLQNLELLQTWSRLNNHSAFLGIKKNNEIETLWKKVLLNQFHDVLPGSCIKEVVDDANKLYADVTKSCDELRAKYLSCWKIQEKGISQDVNAKNQEANETAVSYLFNCKPWLRREVIRTPTFCGAKALVQQIDEDTCYACVEIDGFSCNLLKPLMVETPARLEIDCHDTGVVTLSNEYLLVKFNKLGQIISCVLRKENRECIKTGQYGNTLQMYTDIPLFWDAWDVMPYNEETKETLTESTHFEIIETGPLKASFRVTLKISEQSLISQTISLDAATEFVRFDSEVNWYENRRMLKVAFPFNVHTDYATYEIQAGHVRRPTHCNTSWDAAKYEVCGHKWVDLSEYGFGVSLLNDCKYGFSAYGSTLQMSLLRSPKAPDDQADMGTHSFSYALMPHKGSFQEADVIRRSHDFQKNNRLVLLDGHQLTSSQIFSINQKAVVIDTVKLREDCKDDVIIRMYESFGSHVQKVKLSSCYHFQDVYRTNILEERENKDDNVVSLCSPCEVQFNMKPFEILTLCLKIKDMQ